MSIYKLKSNPEEFGWVEPIGNWFNFFWELQNCKPLGRFDKIIKFKQIKDKPEIVLGDFPTSSIPIISENAKEAIQEHFSKLVEIFPIDIKNKKKQKYYFMNAINIYDCLDIDNSEIEYFTDCSGIMEIKKYVFKELSENKSRIFKIENKERGEIYVNENTKQIIENANLLGFVFEDTSLPYENPFSKILRKQNLTKN
jgi:hypothetical protein